MAVKAEASSYDRPISLCLEGNRKRIRDEKTPHAKWGFLVIVLRRL